LFTLRASSREVEAKVARPILVGVLLVEYPGETAGVPLLHRLVVILPDIRRDLVVPAERPDKALQIGRAPSPRNIDLVIGRGQRCGAALACFRLLLIGFWHSCLRRRRHRFRARFFLDVL
jgi:hypothetical protein